MTLYRNRPTETILSSVSLTFDLRPFRHKIKISYRLMVSTGISALQYVDMDIYESGHSKFLSKFVHNFFSFPAVRTHTHNERTNLRDCMISLAEVVQLKIFV